MEQDYQVAQEGMGRAQRIPCIGDRPETDGGYRLELAAEMVFQDRLCNCRIPFMAFHKIDRVCRQSAAQTFPRYTCLIPWDSAIFLAARSVAVGVGSGDVIL